MNLMTSEAASRLLLAAEAANTAPDVLFFECFSKDEASYGCLTVDRAAFERERDVALGTTNVDYSWTLYEHFQRMRSYRETRFLVDPAGFEVHQSQRADTAEGLDDTAGADSERPGR